MVARSVLLRHDTPDGSWHLDWLVDAAGAGGPDDRNVAAFRVRVRPDEALNGFDAVRLADHRRLYLDFEGPLSGGRGRISRVAEFACRIDRCDATEVALTLLCGPGEREFIGRPVPGAASPDGRPCWRFDPPSPRGV